MMFQQLLFRSLQRSAQFTRCTVPSSIVHFTHSQSRSSLFGLFRSPKRDLLRLQELNEWTPIYKQPLIHFMQLLSRFKLVQTFLVIGFFPAVYLAKQLKRNFTAQNAASPKKSLKRKQKMKRADVTTSTFFGMCVLSLAVLLAFNHYFRRFVGMIFVVYPFVERSTHPNY